MESRKQEGREETLAKIAKTLVVTASGKGQKGILHCDLIWFL